MTNIIIEIVNGILQTSDIFTAYREPLRCFYSNTRIYKYKYMVLCAYAVDGADCAGVSHALFSLVGTSKSHANLLYVYVCMVVLLDFGVWETTSKIYCMVNCYYYCTVICIYVVVTPLCSLVIKSDFFSLSAAASCKFNASLFNYSHTPTIHTYRCTN